jgi:hypothetical protein
MLLSAILETRIRQDMKGILATMEQIEFARCVWRKFVSRYGRRIVRKQFDQKKNEANAVIIFRFITIQSLSTYRKRIRTTVV